MILALDGERERGREIVLEHEVDDAIARYRMFEVKEEYSEDGNFDISQLRVLVEGEPVIRDENGERVQGQGSEA